MKEEEIKRLVKIVEESNIGELEVSRWGRTIKITKSFQNSHSVSSNPSPHTVAVPVPPTQEPTKSVEPAGHPATEAETSHANAIEIKAPMVGTFYRSPSPEAEPYVKENSSVKKGDVLCIIEAMKLMNEIESDHAGRIVKILVENGQPVEYNQPLFLIEFS